jgi:diaminopimelate epimerase
MRLLTDAGDFTTRTAGAGSEAELNLPPFEPPRVVPGLGLASGERKILFATVGVPHLVVLVEDVDRVDLDQRGRVLRYHPLVAPGGANVNFVGHPAAAGQPWPIRTYERGVEGETLACGTGTVAAGAVLIMEGEAESPVWFRSRSGRQLWVKAHYGADRVDEIWLGGEGRLVYQGCWVDA